MGNQTPASGRFSERRVLAGPNGHIDRQLPHERPARMILGKLSAESGAKGSTLKWSARHQSPRGGGPKLWSGAETSTIYGWVGAETQDHEPLEMRDGRDNLGAVMASCDIAQAALFADLLADEVAALRAQLREAEQRWDERRDRSRCEIETPVRLVRLREQLDEARRLSASLRRRRHIANAQRSGVQPIL